MRLWERGNNAKRPVAKFLWMPQLQGNSNAKTRWLLCILFLWQCQMSTEAETALTQIRWAASRKQFSWCPWLVWKFRQCSEHIFRNKFSSLFVVFLSQESQNVGISAKEKTLLIERADKHYTGDKREAELIGIAHSTMYYQPVVHTSSLELIHQKIETKRRNPK